MTQPFVEALNDLLAGSGISQNELARRVGIDPAQVGRWRKGGGLPRPDNITSIAEVFGVDPGWLMSLAYPGSQTKPTAPTNPRLSAFIAEIEAGWQVMDDAARSLAERGTRALFAVQPTQASGGNRQKRGSSNERRELGRHGTIRPEHGADDSLTTHQRFPHNTRQLLPAPA